MMAGTIASSTSFVSILENIGRINYDDTVVIKSLSTKAIFTFFKILVFFTPLIFFANTHELFEFPKMYFVYALGTTIIWIFLFKKIYYAEQIKWPNELILLFLLSYLASTIFSSHPYTSIWGYYTRFNGGLASILVFIGLYLVLINELDINQIRYLAKVACFSLIPISLYAISQHYEITTNIWKSDATERAFSTFGQPNWLAAYTTMLTPLVLGHTFGTYERYSLRAKHKFWWLVLYLTTFAATWFSQSLSGIVGFISGTLAFSYINWDKLKINLDMFTLLMVISISFALFNPGMFKERLEDLYIDIRNLVQVQALELTYPVSTQHNISDPGFIRQHLWKGTTELITSSKKNALIGTGPETFPYEFQRFRPEELNYSSEWNFVFNKPHNYYLELFANIGLIGLAFYLFIVVKSVAKKDAFFTPSLIALYVTNFFGWPTVATALLFWLFLAGIENE
jgi:O-antigen ligase